MDNQIIYERIVEIRNPYRVIEEKLPFVAKLYRAAYDNAPLSNPSIFYPKKTLLRMLSYLLLKMPFIKLKPGEFITEINNQKYVCKFDARNTQFHAIYFNRFKKGYEPETCAILELLIEEKSVFCDIGSNWGFFAGYVGSKEKFDGHIYAFEPQTNVFNDLIKFIKQTSLVSKTTCYQTALSDHYGYGSMQLKDNLHSGLAELIKKKSKDIVIIKKLDDFPINHIDIIKIDAEGHEPDILKGASRKIDNSRPLIIFEYLKAAKNAESAVTFLESKGYDIYSLGWQEIAKNEGVLRLTKFSLDTCYRKKLNFLAYPTEKNISFLSLFGPCTTK
jgi:FkbM family methyltransferase